MTPGEHVLDAGRSSFGRQAWGDAYAQLSAADKEAPLELEGLERLAVSRIHGRPGRGEHRHLGPCAP